MPGPSSMTWISTHEPTRAVEIVMHAPGFETQAASDDQRFML